MLEVIYQRVLQNHSSKVIQSEQIMASISPNSNEICGFLRKTEQNAFIYCCNLCDCEFSYCSALEKHINEHSDFCNLPDKLIEKTFEYLSPNDLAAFSRTCQKYKILAEKYFERNFHCGRAFILTSSSNAPSKRVYFHEGFKCEKYEIIFRSFIPNVFVGIMDPATLPFVFEYIKQNCSKRLRQIALHSFQGVLSLNDVKTIPDQVKDLKIISMLNILNGDRLLNQQKGLQVLQIDSRWLQYDSNDWIDRTYNHLHTFIMSSPKDDSKFLRENWSMFLRNNPQLKIIFCEDEFALQSLLLTDTPLSYAAIRLSSKRLLLPACDLEMCVKRKYIKSLDVIIDEKMHSASGLREIINLGYIKGFHYSINQKNLSVFRKMKIQANVERLCLTFRVRFTATELLKIVDCFPNVYELRIVLFDTTYSTSRNSLCLRNILMPIVGQLDKLKHVHVHSLAEKMQLSSYDVNELFVARSYFSNASHVTIHSTEPVPNSVAAKTLISVQQESLIMGRPICPMCQPNVDPSLLISYLDRLPIHSSMLNLYLV